MSAVHHSHFIPVHETYVNPSPFLALKLSHWGGQSKQTQKSIPLSGHHSHLSNVNVLIVYRFCLAVKCWQAEFEWKWVFILNQAKSNNLNLNVYFNLRLNFTLIAFLTWMFSKCTLNISVTFQGLQRGAESGWLFWGKKKKALRTKQLVVKICKVHFYWAGK